MSWEDLALRLQDHGISISDDKKAKAFILKTNYYKISIFIRYIDTNEKTLDHLIDLYSFDRFISENIFKLITPIEMYLKSTFANFLSMEVYNNLEGYKDHTTPPSLAYLDKNIYKPDKLKKEYHHMISSFSEVLHGKIWWKYTPVGTDRTYHPWPIQYFCYCSG